MAVAVVRLPRGFHAQAARGGSALSWRPGYRGSGAQRITPVPVTSYTGRITQVPLIGGQAQAVIGGTGTVTVSVTPQGLGTIWYPVQVTLSTTTGVLDTSVAQVWLGAQGVPVTLVGQMFTGNGTVALAIPDMTPGLALIATWTGGHQGDTAAMNVIGTMDAITTAK